MANIDIQPDNIYLKEVRLEMGPASRFLARLLIYCTYTLIIVGTIVFLLSEIDWLGWLGILLLLFLIDRALHFGQARKSLIEIKKGLGQAPINIADYLAPKTLHILEKAQERSLILGSDFCLSLAKILIKEKDIEEALLRIDIPPKEFEQKIDDFIKRAKDESSEESNKTERPGRAYLISQIELLGKGSMIAALHADEKFIEPRSLLGALSAFKNERVNQLFMLFSINQDDLENALILGRFKRVFKFLKSPPASLGGFAHKPHELRHRIMNRAWTARPTPTLDKHSVDYTDLAREETVGFLIGHEEEYRRLTDILSRPMKPNALLVGEPGSGKESIIAHLAFEIIKDRIPEPLFDKRLVSLQIGNLISGAGSDEISSRVNKVIEEINLAGNIILYIPDIHNLAKTSGPNFMSAADILIPTILSDAFPLVGTTYPKEFKELIEGQSDFASAFEVIKIEEISESDAVKILTYESVILEEQYKVIVSFGAIKQSVLLAHKYFHQKLLPSSAEDLLKEALADASQKNKKFLETDDVILIAERKINIPIHKAGKEEASRLLNLEKVIHERLVDQEEVVIAVSRALREYRSGLSRKGGPIAVFLFVGPTGVGKTELSKIIAKVQFGSETLMIRFDMSEYQDKQSIFRFIGSPDGRMAGNLTESVIQKPYSLILLDEFEKAHPDILNLFLQVFDDGRLTDNLARTVDFTNTIIIATSNAHSNFIKTHLEAHTPIEIISEELKKKLADFFRPELLNRFSNIIVFKPLSPSNIEAIAKIQLGDLKRDLEETQGINLTFDDAVIKKVSELGYDPVFGARPLRAVISDKLRSVLAEKILKDEIVKGSDIKVKVSGEDFVFVNT